MSSKSKQDDANIKEILLEMIYANQNEEAERKDRTLNQEVENTYQMTPPELN